MKSPETILSELSHFHGSEEFYPYSLIGLPKKYQLTEGVYYLCEAAECFWLVDLILSYQTSLKLMYEPFQVWSLKKKPVGWSITCTDGNKLNLHSEHIPFSDFPLEEITIWLIDGVLMLPSEY